MFSCRLYYNTGFDAINVPASESVLNTVASNYREFGPMDIHQSDFQPVIKIRCPNGEQDVIGADYLMLSHEIEQGTIKTFYSIQDYTMTSPDVAVLSVTMDSFLTMGGVDAVHFTDGMTVRHHVENDVFGKYCEDDPLLVPSQPLQLVHGGSESQARPTHSITGFAYYDGCSGDTGIFFDYENERPQAGHSGTALMIQSFVGIVSAVNLYTLGLYETDPDTGKKKYKFVDPIQFKGLEGLNGEAQVQLNKWYPDVPVSRNIMYHLFKGAIDSNYACPVDLDHIGMNGSNPGLYGQKRLYCSNRGYYYAYNNDYMNPPEFGPDGNNKGDDCFRDIIIPGISVYGYFTHGHLELIERIANGIKNARALGMEGALLDAYSVPAPLIFYGNNLPDYVGDPTQANQGAMGFISGVCNILTTNGYCYEYIDPGTQDLAHYIYADRQQLGDYGQGVLGLKNGAVYDFDYPVGNKTFKNKRVKVGKYNRYILQSPCTGSMTEANPEELILPPGKTRPAPLMNASVAGDHVSDNLAPYIGVASDPRPNGRPYFNFIKRNADFGIVNFYDGAVAGETWRKVPITMLGYSGEKQSDIAYQINKANKDVIASAEYQAAYRMASIEDQALRGMMSHPAVSRNDISYNAGYTNNRYSAGGEWMGGTYDPHASINAGKTAGNVAGSLAKSLIGPTASLAAESIMSGALTGEALGLYRWRENERAREAAVELDQYQLSKSYVEPEIKFLPSESLRDATGNGVFYARFRPSDFDLEKFDEILERFGYRVTEPMQDKFLKVRSKWNYVQVTGARVVNKGNYIEQTQYYGMRASRAILDDVSAMFATGVRIWSVKPGDYNQTNAVVS